MDTMSAEQIREWIVDHVDVAELRGRRVLLIVPDYTRTAPLETLFPALRSLLRPEVAALDVMVALGTHPPMPEQQIRTMLGIADNDP